MERINAYKLINNNSITISENSSFYLDKDVIANEINLFVLSRVNADLLLCEISKDVTINLHVEESATLNIKGLINGESIKVNIFSKNAQNSNISLHFVDFSSGKSFIYVNGDMQEIGATYTWQIASLAAHNDDKKIHVNLEHLSTNLYGDVSSYGVCKDEAKLEIAGTTHIANGASKTVTKQNARIMLVNETSRGIAKPILKIDENDVKASHGASLGQINEEHLFYLKSRGLSETEAKKLIVLGYFNPVILLFKDEVVEEYIYTLLKERV